MKARKRQPARFTVSGYSPAFKKEVAWNVTVGETGVCARRAEDGREISIGWRELFGAAMFYGRDSQRGDTREAKKL